MQTHTTRTRSILLLLLLTLLAACNEYSSSHQVVGDALVNKLHHAILQQQWSDLDTIYSKAYRAQNSSTMEQLQWQQLIKKYGPLQRFVLRSKQKDARLQGEFYIYSYAVVFKHGTVSEIITVLRSGQNESITISGHRLTEGSQ